MNSHRVGATLPVPRTPDPREAPTIRWGVLAPGGIAASFATAALTHTRQRLTAVASRSRPRAEEFAHRHQIPTVHDSYARLVADPAVQAVYIASPHSEHYAQALLAIQAGKHVLVEKPMTRNAAEARDLMAAARTNNVALMEAMKTRFLPRTDVVRQLLADGALGELESFTADHGRRLVQVPRLTDPELAGGALLDLGSYAVSYAVFVLGTPGSIHAHGTLTETGVDRQAVLTLGGFPQHVHAQALVHTTLAAETRRAADIVGTQARIELDDGFYGPGHVRLVAADGAVTASPPQGLAGHAAMAYEIGHFAQMVADSGLESPLMPWDDSLTVLEIMDDSRRQLGVRYPGESDADKATG